MADGVPPPSPSAENEENRFDQWWHRRLMPGLVVVTAVLMVAFFSAAQSELASLRAVIESGPQLEENLIRKLADQAAEGSPWTAFEMMRQSFGLRASLHFAKINLLSIIWLKYMGFLAGMVIAFAGAFFILGKVREPKGTQGQIQINAGGVQSQWQSAYPGVGLVLLGVTLMSITISVSKQFDWNAGQVSFPPYTSLTPDQEKSEVDKGTDKERKKVAELNEMTLRYKNAISSKGDRK